MVVEVENVEAVPGALAVAFDVDAVEIPVADDLLLRDDVVPRHGGLERGNGVGGRAHAPPTCGIASHGEIGQLEVALGCRTEDRDRVRRAHAVAEQGEQVADVLDVG